MDHSPPTRQSHLRTLFLCLCGPHQRTACSGSDIAFHTSSRGALNVRVMTMMGSSFGASILRSCIWRLLGFNGLWSGRLKLGEQFFEAVERLSGAAFHAGGHHAVAGIDRLESRGRRVERDPVLLLERMGLGEAVVGVHAFDAEGVGERGDRSDVAELAVEGHARPVRFAALVAPLAAYYEVMGKHSHLRVTQAPPAGDVLALGHGLPDQRTGRLEGS